MTVVSMEYKDIADDINEMLLPEVITYLEEQQNKYLIKYGKDVKISFHLFVEDHSSIVEAYLNVTLDMTDEEHEAYYKAKKTEAELEKQQRLLKAKEERRLAYEQLKKEFEPNN
jgi:hypothetical protein